MRDLEFNLFETLGLEQVLADEAFGDLGGESVREMLSEAARLAEGPVAERSPTATATRRRSIPTRMW